MGQILPSGEFGGLDLITDDIAASPNRARVALNIQKRNSSSLKRRQGYKASSTNSGNNGGFGGAVYRKRNKTTGVVTKERLIVGSKLFKLKEHTLTISYTGSTTGIVEALINPSTLFWEFTLYENGASVLNTSLGVGFDEASTVTVTDLVALINAVANFSASISGGGSTPAAMLPVIPSTQIESSEIVTFYESIEVNHPTSATSPFQGAFDNRNQSSFENVSSVQINDVIYFGSKWDERVKYDGVDCYRAGMPQLSNPSLAGSGAGALPLGTYKYALIAKQKDAQGNIVEGIESSTVSVTTAGAQNINVTITNILASSGFNTDCAIVNGAQVSVSTITVDNGSGGSHTMKVGQTAYFYDAVSASYVEREITAKTATTITITGAAVTVADNAVISNNLRIVILRTVQGGTALQDNVEIPNNSFSATQVYNDGLLDASLGALYDSPALDGVEHGLPPKCGYLSVFDKAVVSAGNLQNPDRVYWSVNGNPEYAPSSYSDNVPGSTNSSITGLTSGDRFFWIMKEDECFLVTGNLFTAQYSITQKGDKVGCMSHSSIARSDRMNLWLSNGAVFASIDGSIPQRISDDISPVFNNSGKDEEKKLKFKRAVGVVDKKHEYFILFIPAESLSGSDVYANSDSRVFAFDLRRQEWWEWTNLNMAGGAFADEDGEELFWVERKLSTYSSTVVYKTHHRINTDSIYDYVDHNQEIPWSYVPAGWYHEGQPDVNKKYSYVSLYTTDSEKVPVYVLSLKTEKDFIDGAYHTELSHTFGDGENDGWGYEAWGSFGWGNPAPSKATPRRLKAGFVKSLRVSFYSSGIYKEIVLSGISRHVEAPFKIDIKEARSS